MPSGYLGNLGQLGLGIDRMESQLPAGMYDPNQFINPAMLPYMGMYLQPQMMKQMMNFQNPQLMLPQNSGSFFANALGKLFGGQQDNGLAQSSQTQPQQGQGGQPQNQLLQDIYARRNANLQNGMQLGQAEAAAVSQLTGNPNYQDPNSQAVLSRFQQDAIKNGYDPKIAQQQQYQYSNYLNTKTGQTAAFNPQQFASLSDRANWVKAESTPQIAPGRIQQNLEDGKYVLRQTQPDGTQKIIGTSSSPMQFINSTGTNTNKNLNVSGQDIVNHPSLANSLTTGSASDINKENLEHQQVHVQNFDGIMGTVQGLLKQGAAGGTAGEYFEKIDNAIGSVGKFADTIGDTDTFTKLVKDSNAGMGNMGGIITRFKLSGKQAIQLNTAFNSAAYEWWRAQNPDGRMTPKELTEARDEIFGDTADPNAQLAGMQTASRIMHSNLINSQKASGVGPFGPTHAPVPDDIGALVKKYAGS